ncbi:MAG: protein translocase subunit SecF [Candidatus Nanoarchaeia archaeon]
MRRSDRIQRKFALSKQKEKQTQAVDLQKESRTEKKSFYNKYYKQLLIIPILLFIASVIIIGIQVATTGDFIEKGISLKGGTSVTVTTENVDKTLLIQNLQEKFPEVELNSRTIENGGIPVGIIIESDISSENQELSNEFIDTIRELTGATDAQLSVETIGASLGNSFFKQAIISLLVAFVLISIVVFLYFKSFVPSALVVIAIIADMVMTIAALDVLHIKVGTAGIAAILMLIGYSVDTDILLTMRVLKRKEGQSVYGETVRSMKTGMMMVLVTMVAVLAAIFVAQSPVLKEILIILVIGLVFDVINTWIQNAGLLRWYLEKKGQY